MSTQVELFNGHWAAFTARLREQLQELSQTQRLTYENAAQALEEAALGWTSPEDEAGRWLKTFTQQYPKRGETVREILTQELRLTEPPARPELPKSFNYVIPLAGMAVGLGIAALNNASVPVMAAAGILPGVVLIPAVRALSGNLKNQGKSYLLEEYMVQLELFQAVILSIVRSADEE